MLITQWEVARKRAGVGGATQLTAQWWPWYAVGLVSRIPAAAFVPRPSVDGLLLVSRRTAPLLPDADRARYQRWVAQVFGGPGRGVPDVLVRSGLPRTAVRRWSRQEGLCARHLPRDLTARQWVDAFRLGNAL